MSNLIPDTFNAHHDFVVFRQRSCSISGHKRAVASE